MADAQQLRERMLVSSQASAHNHETASGPRSAIQVGSRQSPLVISLKDNELWAEKKRTNCALSSGLSADLISRRRREYDAIASEYYGSDHLTTRNFEAATAAYINRHPIRSYFKPVRTLIDLGCGGGMVHHYLGRNFRCDEWIELDESERMLALERPYNLGSIQVCADARATPLKAGTADLATAFLFDPFNDTTFPYEVRRILRKNGMFIGTLPAAEWALPFRHIMGVPADTAVFRLVDGNKVHTSSHISTRSDLSHKFHDAGFSRVIVSDCFVPPAAKEVSSHIQLIAEAVNVPATQLPVVTMIIAWR